MRKEKEKELKRGKKKKRKEEKGGKKNPQHKRRPRRDSYKGCVLSRADCSVHLGRRSGKLQKVWEPQTPSSEQGKNQRVKIKEEPKGGGGN